ncbi:MAG: MFS transporter, partial [Spirochaetes bacterium]|nr:MFS transporter [Spirochaetota bacterium]
MKRSAFPRDLQFYKFSTYGFLKNLKFFDPFIILFFKEMGLSFFQIGILFAIREVATNFLEMPTGIVADSFGRRSSMIFSFISYIISFIIFYLFPFFWIYAIAMIFFAFGEAFRTGTHKAMILEYLKIKNLTQHKVDYYGHTRAASQLGAALSSIIAAVLVFYSGSYKIIFLASTIPYILDLLLMISYPKELDGEIIK